MMGNPSLADLQRLLDPHGLLIRGGLPHDGGYLVLVGNAGSEMWSPFRDSGEYRDGRAHPMDRWTRRIGDKVSRQAGARAIYPFEGPPYTPFLAWASEAERVFTSPISMRIHPEYGLWHAYRFALVFDRPSSDISEPGVVASPCDSCSARPCLAACPADAFSTGSYDVDRCMDYLAADDHSPCREAGCAARRACPAGRDYVYEPDHARFHMDAFVRSYLLCATGSGAKSAAPASSRDCEPSSAISGSSPASATSANSEE